ncbi:unannotated protein [freshwater metagenome]|uniref:Unannotated protein n=1 Tax=freshwater metagenome TaxID=449393 RepID=A0A6J7EQD4_9ZZZZ
MPRLDLARVRALCFDVDGTLSDTDNAYVAALARLMPDAVPFDRRRTARRFVMSLQGPVTSALSLADRLGLYEGVVQAFDWRYRHRGAPLGRQRLLPGVHELLAGLHGRFPMAVVSARDRKGTERFLRESDLLRYFDVVVTARSARRTKPFPDPILLAADAMGVEPDECLMIGDTTVDIRAAVGAGAQSVGVLCGFGRERALRRMGATAIVHETSDLAVLLATT